MRTKRRRRLILIELDGFVQNSDISASPFESAADISMKMREKGWAPYRVRFDHAKESWIVSSLDYSPPRTSPIR